jgi:phosphohistidine phosphatase SixA
MHKFRLIPALASALLLMTQPVLAQSTGAPADAKTAQDAKAPKAKKPAKTAQKKATAPKAPVPVATLKNLKLPGPELIKAMQAGGLILLIRHERTEVPSRDDDYSRPISDCTAQRNLSIAGYAGAQETGVALRTLDIKVSKVLSSEMCRTMATGMQMFGRVTAEPKLLHHDNVPERTLVVSGAELNALMAQQTPEAGSNIVFISHIGNIFFATGMRLSEGEIGLVQRQKDGKFVILGQMVANDLGAHARQFLYLKEQAEKAPEEKSDAAK